MPFCTVSQSSYAPKLFFLGIDNGRDDILPAFVKPEIRTRIIHSERLRMVVAEGVTGDQGTVEELTGIS